MAHDHLHELKEDPLGRTSRQIVATLLGGILLLNSMLAQYLFAERFYTDTLALLAALLLGVPLVSHALKDILHGHSHMDELVALAFLAAFAQGAYHSTSGDAVGAEGGYQTAGAIAFFMVLSTLIENRTAQGARASIESLIRITPTRA